jgi:hypothetical protein
VQARGDRALAVEMILSGEVDNEEHAPSLLRQQDQEEEEEQQRPCPVLPSSPQTQGGGGVSLSLELINGQKVHL